MSDSCRMASAVPARATPQLLRVSSPPAGPVTATAAEGAAVAPARAGPICLITYERPCRVWWPAGRRPPLNTGRFPASMTSGSTGTTVAHRRDHLAAPPTAVGAAAQTAMGLADLSYRSAMVGRSLGWPVTKGVVAAVVAAVGPLVSKGCRSRRYWPPSLGRSFRTSRRNPR